MSSVPFLDIMHVGILKWAECLERTVCTEASRIVMNLLDLI